MTIATGVGKKVAYAKEASTGWNVAPASTNAGAKYLRRITSDIDLSKDTYESQEIRSDYQIGDVRHGGRKVGGTIKGELSPGAYSDFLASALRKDFVTAPSLGATSCTFVTGSPATLTIAGFTYTNGLKAGMVVRTNTGTNSGKNIFISSITGATCSVSLLNGGTIAAETTSCTVVAQGKYTYAPESSHTRDSYTIEHWFSDISVSEMFTGCRVNTIDIGLPSTGMATCDTAVLGGNLTTGATQYLTGSGTGAPTAATSYGLLTAVNGALFVAGTQYAVVTAASLKIEGGMTTGSVVGSNYTPDVFPGRVKVTGSMTVYFQNATLRDLFTAETAFELLLVLTSDNSDTADFMSFALYNCKALGATKTDGEQGLSMTMPFQALFNSTPADNTTTDQLRTTLMVQDARA